MISGRAVRGIAAAGLAVGVTTMGSVADAATTTETVVQVVDLGDTTGATGVDLFDPSLGTLTGVTYTVGGEVRVQVCIENLSVESSSTTGGPASGQLAVTLAGTTVPVSLTLDVPATTLGPSNGSDDCAGGYDAGTASFPGTVSSADVYFDSQQTSDTGGATITDPAALASWVASGGTTTADISWTSGSGADINQPSEWDIWFIAEGSLDVTVEYEYEPTPPSTTTTTTVPGATTTTAPPAATTTTTTPGQLPATGSSNGGLVLTAGALVLAGGALTAAAMRRRHTAR